MATCGTAFTEDHVRLLKRYASRMVLAFDADAAGQGAAERFYEWEQKYQVQVAVARLPGGQDPGELAQTDPQGLAAAVADATPFLAFRLQRVIDGRAARTPEDRARLAERAMAVVNEHPDVNVRKLYAGQVASRGRAAGRRPRPPGRAAPAAPDGRGGPGARSGHLGRTPSSSPSPCSPRTGSRSPSGWSRSCSTTRRTAGPSSPWLRAEGNLTAAIEAADPEAREVLERAAVADVGVDPEAEARNLIAAAVRRELAVRSGDDDAERIRDDREARLQLESLMAPNEGTAAAEWLLGWLHRRVDERSSGGP